MALADGITAQLARIDAQILDVKTRAAADVTRLQNLKVPLEAALAKLATDSTLEPLLDQLKTAGLVTF